ncbi:MAG TPA: MFS transporter, partial [Kofleriaceae bacterium]
MTTSTGEPSNQRDLWRHADFLRLWAAQAVSAFGSRITRTALPIIAVVALRQPEAMIGVLAAMQLVPGIFLAMLAGGFVDRGRKRRILIVADLVRGALVASLTLAWELGALSMPQLIIVGAGVGAASALFQITDVAYLPQLIGRRRLAEGNAKLETTEAIAEITGPASAGVLISALGAPGAVVIDALSYLWSAIMLGRIRAADAPGETGSPAADELAS